MTQTPIGKLIIKMALPAMVSMLISALYNVVDSIFVAQIGEGALAAVSLAFPIQSLIVAVGVGAGVGLSSFVSRQIGAKNTEKASAAANHAVMIGLAVGLFFAVAGIFLIKPFFSLFTQDAQIFQDGCIYSYIVTIFSFGIAVQLNVEKAIQGTGNMIAPMFIVLLGAVINIILDPILIFGYFGVPAMGVAGAAIATVIGQISSMVLSLVLFYRNDYGLAVKSPFFKPDFKILKQIFSVGVPAIFMQSLSSILILLLNIILSLHSQTAVAVMGIYFKLQLFVFMPVFGITQGVRPVMGYFFGSANKQKLLETLKKASVMTTVIMVLGTTIFIVFAPFLMKAFNPTPEMSVMGISALRIISLSFVFAGGNLMLSTLFQSCGYGKRSLLISAMREIIFIVIPAFLLSRIYDLNGVWISFLIAEMACLVVAYLLYKRAFNGKILEI